MLRPIALSNAVTTVVAGLYVICATLSIIAPDLVVGIGQSWIHTLNLEAVKATSSLTWGSFILGLVSISILAWAVTYATIALYNNFAHREQELERHHKGYISA